MLTLLEVTDAINTFDAEPSTIYEVCLNLVKKELQDKPQLFVYTTVLQDMDYMAQYELVTELAVSTIVASAAHEKHYETTLGFLQMVVNGVIFVTEHHPFPNTTESPAYYKLLWKRLTAVYDLLWRN
jgi:hypothetical protein